uniref:Zinc finger and BTB domain containing 8B n=1 Tax=Neogobius melanostomus TaxID=47308 RepID=A0A8C6TJH8_9GOBI
MEVPCYLPRLVADLNEQRKRDFFCDCSVLVEGRVFKAHRNVLFAGSGYFRALLVHYLQDNNQRHCTASLDIVTADAFSIILDFIYLQMTDLVNFCKGYISSSLEICNKERERNAGRENQSKDKADTRAVSNSAGTMTNELQSEVEEADRGACQSGTSGKTPPSLSDSSPAGTSREVDSNFQFPSKSSQQSNIQCRHLIEMLARGEGPVPIVERESSRFASGLDSSLGSSRMDEGVSFVGSTMMETQSDWLGEDTGKNITAGYDRTTTVYLHIINFNPEFAVSF